MDRTHDATKRYSKKDRRQGDRGPLGIAIASAWAAVVLALCLPPVSAKALHAHHSFSRTPILGRYVTRWVTVGPNPFPPAPVCKVLVANFNQFRDVPFESNNPRLSPKYPQFRRPDWKPMAWDPQLGEMVYSGCPNKVCLRAWMPGWRYWEKKTEPLRKADKTLLWRTRVDLLGDGRFETIILLTHFFPANWVRGKIVPVPVPKPYCRYIDSRLYMLPSPYPKMAEAFNNGPRAGWGVFGTDLIQDAGNEATPYLSLAWTRSVPGRGIGVSVFMPNVGAGGYFYNPLCNIRWIPRGE